jgi:hypothetical protein
MEEGKMRQVIAWAIVCLIVATGTIVSAADISKINPEKTSSPILQLLESLGLG